MSYDAFDHAQHHASFGRLLCGGDSIDRKIKPTVLSDLGGHEQKEPKDWV